MTYKPTRGDILRPKKARTKFILIDVRQKSPEGYSLDWAWLDNINDVTTNWFTALETLNEDYIFVENIASKTNSDIYDRLCEMLYTEYNDNTSQ